jgi:hypothetical protein
MQKEFLYTCAADTIRCRSVRSERSQGRESQSDGAAFRLGIGSGEILLTTKNVQSPVDKFILRFH